jgi:hypothetical protein
MQAGVCSTRQAEHEVGMHTSLSTIRQGVGVGVVSCQPVCAAAGFGTAPWAAMPTYGHPDLGLRHPR